MTYHEPAHCGCASSAAVLPVLRNMRTGSRVESRVGGAMEDGNDSSALAAVRAAV